MPDMVEVPHATVPAPVGPGSEHSGMIAAPLGAPLIETGGRSRAPLIIAGAALGGFIVVGLLAVAMGRRDVPAATPPPPQTVVITQPAPPVAPAPGAASPSAVTTAVAVEELAPERPAPGEKPPAAKGGRSRPRSVGPAAAPAPAAPAAPAKAPATPAPSDVDLSNPYR
jgi:hypothetical protein